MLLPVVVAGPGPPWLRGPSLGLSRRSVLSAIGGMVFPLCGSAFHPETSWFSRCIPFGRQGWALPVTSCPQNTPIQRLARPLPLSAALASVASPRQEPLSPARGPILTPGAELSPVTGSRAPLRMASPGGSRPVSHRLLHVPVLSSPALGCSWLFLGAPARAFPLPAVRCKVALLSFFRNQASGGVLRTTVPRAVRSGGGPTGGPR